MDINYPDMALQTAQFNWLKIADPLYMGTYYQQETDMADIVNRTEHIILFNLNTHDLILKYVTKMMWLQGMGQSW